MFMMISRMIQQRMSYDTKNINTDININVDER